MATLADFHNIHAGEPIIVAGTGPSVVLLTAPERWITIGLNGIDRHFPPSYCVSIDAGPVALEFVRNSTARAVFLGRRFRHELEHPRAVDLDPDVLGMSFKNTIEACEPTATAAIQLAIFMGARTIGLIGVDFYARQSERKLERQRQFYYERTMKIRSAAFARLAEEMRSRQVEVFNLSPDSMLVAFPKISLAEFTTVG